MLVWFEENPARYWLIICLILALVGFLTVRPLLQKRAGREARRSDGWWAMVILAVLFAGRWPTLVVPREYNPDESVMIAAWESYRHDPMPWRSVDTVTSGPLNVYALAPVAALLGANNYLAARLTALLLLAAGIALAHQVIASEFGVAVARASSLPIAMVEALTLHPDFQHYSSELCPMVLLTAAFAMGLKQIRQSGNPAYSALFGALLGLVPLAKIQATPIALTLGAVYLIEERMRARAGRPGANSRCAAAVLGALAPFGLIAVILTLTSQWTNATISYVLNSLTYAKEGVSSLRLLGQQLWQSLTVPGTLFLAWLFWIAVAGITFILIRPPLRGHRPFVCGAVAFLLSALLCVVIPHRPFAHYLQLVAIPGTLLLAATYGTLAETYLLPRWTTRSRMIAAGVFLPAVAIFLLRAPLPHPVVPRLSFYRQLPSDPVIQMVHRLSKPTDSLGVWGWRNRYYAEAGLRPATHEAFSAAQIFPGPYQEFYRDRYMADLNRSQPAVFIDASVAPEFGFTDENLMPAARFPRLGAWLEANYTLVAKIDSARIFVRNKRLKP